MFTNTPQLHKPLIPLSQEGKGLWSVILVVRVLIGSITQLAEKVDLPYFGETDLAWVAMIGGGTALLIGVMWLRYRKNTTSKTKQQKPTEVYIAGQTGVDPAGNTGVIDPMTGYVYDSPQDLERLGELAIENYASVIYYPPQFVPDVRREHGGDDDDKKKKGFTTNEQWVDAAVKALEDEFDVKHLTDVLNDILAGQEVTAKDKAIFMDAVKELGPPPQGYPKPIRLEDSDAHPKDHGADTDSHSSPSDMVVETTASSFNF